MHPLAILLATVSLAGCTRPLVVDGAYSPDAARTARFSNILVVGLSPDRNQRCAFEYSMTSHLRSSAVTATSSCAVMAANEPLERAAIERVVAELGADAVLVTRLVAGGGEVREGATRDARGGAYYKAEDIGYAAVGYWPGHGVYGMPVVYVDFEVAPSVFTIQGNVEVATNLFETRTASVVYVVETRARNLTSREQALATITPAIAAELRKAGVVP